MHERELNYSDAVKIQEIIDWSATKRYLSLNDLNKKRNEKISESDFDFYMAEILKIRPAIFTKSGGYGLDFEPTSALIPYSENGEFIKKYFVNEQHTSKEKLKSDFEITNLTLQNAHIPKSSSFAKWQLIVAIVAVLVAIAAIYYNSKK